MTEEELKQEAEEYCANNCGDCYGCHKKYRKNKNCERLKSMIKTYLAVAEPREKQIVELEKENAELKADNDARKFAMAMSEKVEKQLREENAELIHENARLVTVIDESKSWGISPLNHLIIKNLDYQLTKAKVALRKVVDYLGQFRSDYPDCVIEAENFLKESEVEK